MAGMIGGSALLGLFLGSWFLGGSPTILVGKKSSPSAFADYACFVFTIFCHHARASYGLRILIGIGLGGDYSVGHTFWLNFPRAAIAVFCWAHSAWLDRRLCAGKYCRTSLYFRKPEAWRWLLASAALPALLITLFAGERQNHHAGYCARGVLQKPRYRASLFWSPCFTGR